MLKVKNRGYFFDHTSKDLTDYTGRRRSLYLPVVRNNGYDVFQLLDFPDPAIPSGDRPTTTVSPQALMMLNSDLIMQAATDFAHRLLDGALTDEQRLQFMYRLAYGRSATAAEVTTSKGFLNDAAVRSIRPRLIRASAVFERGASSAKRSWPPMNSCMSHEPAPLQHCSTFPPHSASPLGRRFRLARPRFAVGR